LLGWRTCGYVERDAVGLMLRSLLISICFALCLLVWIGVALALFLMTALISLADSRPVPGIPEVLMSPPALLLWGALTMLTVLLAWIWRKAT
jgi:hypothetical protein